ncbi:unnamed protein product [Clavelina lepadiformis]|uniref:Uncharacterized protein n=1 Tax=Clavelina lepadiformis TaxID=159417 RepID=A0ABP0GAW4_CLALP
MGQARAFDVKGNERNKDLDFSGDLAMFADSSVDLQELRLSLKKNAANTQAEDPTRKPICYKIDELVNYRNGDIVVGSNRCRIGSLCVPTLALNLTSSKNQYV